MSFKFVKSICLILFVLPLAENSLAGDWPAWRGPKRDGKSTEKGLQKKWSDEAPPMHWQIDNLGKGYSSVSIVGERIFTMGARKGKCFLIALDRKTGKELWSTRVGRGNPNCTPTVDGDLVYALGRRGSLVCAKITDGSIVWKKNFSRDFAGRMMTGWGYSESPLVDGDKLICTPGGTRSLIVALNKKTGKTIWRARQPKEIGINGKNGAGYSSVVIGNGAGVKQYIQLTGRGLVSVDAKTGKVLWTYNRIANGTANIPTPIVKDDYVFCSTGYGTGAALLKLSKTRYGVNAEEVYFLHARQLQNHHGGMILVGDHIYCGHGHKQGLPICVELKTGKIAWGGRIRGAGTGSAAVVYADGMLFFRYRSGTMAIIDANPNSYRLLGSFRLATNHDKSWPHPVIVDGKLYLRDQQTLMCYDIARKSKP